MDDRLASDLHHDGAQRRHLVDMRSIGHADAKGLLAHGPEAPS
jgi:hypothetical protein